MAGCSAGPVFINSLLARLSYNTLHTPSLVQLSESVQPIGIILGKSSESAQPIRKLHSKSNPVISGFLNRSLYFFSQSTVNYAAEFLLTGNIWLLDQS